MTDHVRKIDDVVIELLRELSAMPVGAAKLTDALRKYDSRTNLASSLENARKAIDKLGRELTRMTGGTVDLLQARGRLGSFATEACTALSPALVKILTERQAAQARAARSAELEWLQLCTCLDRAPLRIGAYQAHAERFLSAAVQQMTEYFPWVDCRLDLEEFRSRDDMFRGRLRSRFDSGEFDFMLVPRESEQSHLDKVYTYSFRVIAHPAVLRELIDDRNFVHVRKLLKRRLIVAADATSSRQRLHALLLDEGADIEDSSFDLLEENNPNLMRLRAETGQGIAVMSDEYAAVGGAAIPFPYLVQGPTEERATICRVDMVLLKRADASEPRHRAFDFVIQQLIAQEVARERSAAQA